MGFGTGFASNFKVPEMMQTDRANKQTMALEAAKMEQQTAKEKLEEFTKMGVSISETAKLAAESGSIDDPKMQQQLSSMIQQYVEVGKVYTEKGYLPQGAIQTGLGQIAAAASIQTPQQKSEAELVQKGKEKEQELTIANRINPKKTPEQEMNEFKEKETFKASLKKNESSLSSVTKPVYDNQTKETVFRTNDQIMQGGDRYIPVPSKSTVTEFERQLPRLQELSVKEKAGPLSTEESVELAALKNTLLGQRQRGISYNVREDKNGTLYFVNLDTQTLVPAKDPEGNIVTSGTQARSDRTYRLGLNKFDQKKMIDADQVYKDFANEHKKLMLYMDNVNFMLANSTEYDQPAIDKAIANAFVRMVKPTGEISSEKHIDALSGMANIAVRVLNGIKSTLFTGAVLPDNVRTQMLNTLNTRYIQAEKLEQSVITKAQKMAEGLNWQPPYDIASILLEQDIDTNSKTYVIGELSDEELLDIDTSKLTPSQLDEFNERMNQAGY